MKYLIVCVILLSCNNDKPLNIQEINSLHKKLSIQEQRAKQKFRSRRMLATDTALFDSTWNRPYQITKDTSLTIDRYLNYCGGRELDPRVFIDSLLQSPIE